MSKKKNKNEPLEEALHTVMKSISNQIAREMQRTPSEREEHGVLKWEPYMKRVERLVPFILNEIGEQKIDLDALIVLSQTMVKALSFYIEDLGTDGLGTVRQMYCQSTLEKIEQDLRKAFTVLNETNEPTLM